MALSQEQDRIYTLNDIYELPEGTRAELIDGQIYYMAPPSTTHQRISMNLSYEIKKYISSKNGSCDVFTAPFAVFLNEDDAKYLEPDISIICDSSKLDDKGCHGAPDWIIEISSPSNQRRDYVLKLNKYMAAGVREYWIVDPIKKSVAVYYFESNMFTLNYTFEDTIKVNIYDDFHIDFKELNI